MGLKEIFAGVGLFITIILYIILVVCSKEQNEEHKYDVFAAKLAILVWVIIFAAYLKVYVIDLLFGILFLYEILKYHKSKKERNVNGN